MSVPITKHLGCLKRRPYKRIGPNVVRLQLYGGLQPLLQYMNSDEVSEVREPCFCDRVARWN